MQNQYLVKKRTFEQKLFPSRRVNPPEEKDLAEGYSEVGVVTYFNLVDRLRLIVSGFIKVQVYIQTDRPIKKMISSAITFVLPPSFKKEAKIKMETKCQV